MASLNGASDEIAFPRISPYTVINRTLTTEQETVLEQSLRLVPVQYALISDIRDIEFARRLNIPEILRAPNPADAIRLAEELYEIEGTRSLIVTAEGAACS